jgi:hypothetical protein
MWTERSAAELVGPVIDQALALARPRSASRAKALVARAFADPRGAEGADEALSIAKRLDDPHLLSGALDARQTVAMAAGNYEGAWSLGVERLALIERITDPDVQADIVQSLIPPCVATCRFAMAGELARQNDEITQPLTSHHRMHGVAGLAELAELLGEWDSLLALEERIRGAVAANAGTPCTQGARALLFCAVAAACLGDHEGADRLEREADALGLPGRDVLDAPRLRLALVRGQHERAAELLDRLLTERGWYRYGHWTSFATVTVEIDAAALLGRAAFVEEYVERVGLPGTYLEPVVQRARGIVLDDGALLEGALARFEALGLGWHAAQTRALLHASTVGPNA